MKATTFKITPENHKLVVKRADQAQWMPGLREDLEYRDVGIREATNGEFGAQVIRVVQAGLEHKNGRHLHATAFQMLYVLEGRARFFFEGMGETEVVKGDCFYQPDGLVHEALWLSDDCQLLEITLPAEFKTAVV